MPVTFLAYQRFRPYGSETVQPEQVFLPEKTAFMSTNFTEFLPSAVKWPEVHSQLDAEKHISEFFFREFFEISHLREELRQKKEIMQGKGLSFEKIRWQTYTRSNMFDLNIFPNYYWFCNSLNDFDLLLGSYLRSKISHDFSMRDRAPYDIASTVLRNLSFKEFLDDFQYMDVPHEVIEMKAEDFTKRCIILSGINDETFDEYITKFLECKRFANTDTDIFAGNVNKDFEIEIENIYGTCIYTDHLPKYEVTDAHYKTINIDRSRRVENLYATVTNISDVPGVLTARTSDIDEGSQTLNFSLKPGQAKKIGFTSYIPYRKDFFCIQTFLSNNEYRTYIDAKTSTFIEQGMPFDGVQIIETPPTLHEQGHMVIDNLDDGFSILPVPHKIGLRAAINSLLYGDQPTNTHFASYSITNPPAKWTLSRYQSGFQGHERAFHYIRSGDGSQCVQWETEIIRPGTYEVAYFFPGKNTVSPVQPGKRRWVIEEFHFTIHHANGLTEKNVDMQQQKYGWMSLGIYDFEKGPAKVVLSDKSAGTFVYADMVKFDII